MKKYEELSDRKRLPGDAVDMRRKNMQGRGISPLPADKRALIGGSWGKAAYIFIGAAGIAVRYIAPWVKDKYTDSPVLVIDEKGQYVIPAALRSCRRRGFSGR